MTDEQLDQDIAPETNGPDETAARADENAPPQYGVGPFSVREVILAGVWVVAFIVSFFSVTTLRFDSVWTSGLLWILTIGVPTVAVFLIVLRRLSPDGIRRVGSLGIDQFASVAFSVSAVLWIQLLWETVAIVIADGPWVRSWVMWVELVLMLAGVVLTVFAPFVPGLEEDFQDRREVPAHRNARPIRPVVARPVAPRSVQSPTTDRPAEPGYDATASPESGHDQAVADADEAWAPANEVDPLAGTQPRVSHQAFWALSPVERDVVDESGAPLFQVGPSAWALVIEDRGDAFVIRHEDGTVGLLTDVSGVTRG